MTPASVVIVGAGQAGAACALALRQSGFGGRLTMVGAEPHPPYERPPLSKQVLLTGVPSPPMVSPQAAADASITLELAVCATGFDPAARRVALGDGRTLSYDALVLATGGKARELAGLPADGNRVHVLRSRDDALRLARRLPATRRLLVVGAGWLGLEVAAAARARGIEVVAAEAAAQLCVRSLPPVAADWLAALHRSHGVALRLGAAAKVHRDSGRVVASWPDGAETVADAACVCVGMSAEDALARNAGLDCDDGVLTDGCGRTSADGVFAIGDVARLRHDGLARRVRLESWHNANTQAALAAQAIMGGSPLYAEPPLFWSEQYDRRIQVVGIPVPDGSGEPLVTAGEAGAWRVTAGGRLVAAITVDRPREAAQARRELSAEMKSSLDERSRRADWR